MNSRHLQYVLAVSAGLLFVSPAPGADSATPAEVGKIVREAATYQPGQSREALRRLEEWTAQAAVDSSTQKALEAGLIQLLEPASTFEARWKTSRTEPLSIPPAVRQTP